MPRSEGDGTLSSQRGTCDNMHTHTHMLLFASSFFVLHFCFLSAFSRTVERDSAHAAVTIAPAAVLLTAETRERESDGNVRVTVMHTSERARGCFSREPSTHSEHTPFLFSCCVPLVFSVFTFAPTENHATRRPIPHLRRLLSHIHRQYQHPTDSLLVPSSLSTPSRLAIYSSACWLPRQPRHHALQRVYAATPR